ncbi:MAG: Flp pilus assembly complex ATPase component TadA, partial [Phycisphaerales bacterium]|nr:Flp pilus assembly complex ATPase component TadA [Phycisphaerales bacterium]
MPKLEVKSNGKKTLFPIGKDRMTIGRQEGNDIVIAEKVASRRHCEIVHEGGQIIIKDLKSANGTWLGENRIVEAELTFDDTIRIGSTFIRLIPDHVRAKKGRKAPVATIVEEIEDEIPQGSIDGSVVSATLAVRQLAAGPLSKQLAPLLAASVSMTPPAGAPSATKEIRLINRRGKLLTSGEGKTEKAADAIEALRQLLFVAFRTRATDLHVEPKPETYGLRFRIDGIMHSVGEITSKIGDALMNVIKVLCDIDISKRTVVQEGNFSVELQSRRVDFRINMTPTMHGQKLALRFLDKGTVPDNFHG